VKIGIDKLYMIGYYFNIIQYSNLVKAR